MAATTYTVFTAQGEQQGTPFSRKEYAVKAADKLAAATPGTEYTVRTAKGKDVHAALVAAPVEQATEGLHTPEEGEEVVFLVAKRLADHIVKHASDYRADVVAALKAAEVHRSTGKGHQLHVSTSETTAKAMRRVFKELHLGLAAGMLEGADFRLTTTERHIGRVDFALQG